MIPFNTFHWHAYQSFLELNPEYSVSLLDDVACRQFIKRHFLQKVLDAYDSLIAKAFRADLFRYCYIFIKGGCYFDNKMIARLPLRQVIKPDESFLVCSDATPGGKGAETLSVTSKLYNAVICAAPREERMQRTIDVVVDTITRRDTSDQNLAITGPIAFYRSVQQHIEESNVRFYHEMAQKVKRRYQDYYVIEKQRGKLFLTKKFNGHMKSTSSLHYDKLWKNGRVYYEGGTEKLSWMDLRLFVEQGNLDFYDINVNRRDMTVTASKWTNIPAAVSEAVKKIGRQFIFGADGSGVSDGIECKLLNESSSVEYFFRMERPSELNPVTRANISDVLLATRKRRKQRGRL
jgi:mannosyltransferase OCH1-like enzyme